MKNAVIDIGSNSVRMMLIADGVTLSKRVETTRLGEGIAASGVLKCEAMERTAQAVQNFCAAAAAEGAPVRAFATEAVRAAKNGGEFVKLVAEKTGLTAHVLTGHEEAACGYIGATKDMQALGCVSVIDIGGASTEFTTGTDTVSVCTKSLPVGVVRIYDTCGENERAAKEYIAGILSAVPARGETTKYIGIGGTITNLAAALYGVIPYDAERVHGSKIEFFQLKALSDKLYAASVPERIAMGIDAKRADLICGGVTLLLAIMEQCKINEIIASESDNLEGYWLRYCRYTPTDQTE